MANKPDIHWPGQSGTKYDYWIYPIGSPLKAEPGNYIFAKKTSSGAWLPVYIGESKNLDERLSNHNEEECVRRNDGTHVHAHTNPDGQNTRRNEERDLIAKWNPPCNG